MSDTYYNDREHLRLMLENILECFDGGWSTTDQEGNWFAVNGDLEEALVRAEDALNRLDNDDEDPKEELDDEDEGIFFDNA